MTTTKNPSRARRFLKRAAVVVVGTVALVALVCVVVGWRAFGHRAAGDRRARMERSAQWHHGHFENPQPMHNDPWLALRAMMHVDPHVAPDHDVATAVVDKALLAQPAPSGLRVTWLGHSTSLVEIDGTRVLLDPIWGERASPLPFAGPRRFYRPPVALEDLPHVDAVVVSHDHYDHLDMDTIVAIKDWDTKFVVPLGIGAHLEYWGVPASHIVELDWWEQAQVGALSVTCTPSRHASGRMLVDDAATLWSSFAFKGPVHNVWYSGDTGLFPALKEIGERLGPFDLTLIEVGQYHSAWPDWHLGPEQAVSAHQLVRGKAMLPVHWGTFGLAFHSWTEPIERALVAADAAHVPIAAPKPGQTFEPSTSLPRERWWPALPWNSAAQDPIHASQMN